MWPLVQNFCRIERQTQVVGIAFYQHGNSLQVVGRQSSKRHAAYGHQAKGLARAANEWRRRNELVAGSTCHQGILQMQRIA